ncbi:hypothetical protein OC845_006294, partial [Tilletia horrida]
ETSPRSLSARRPTRSNFTPAASGAGFWEEVRSVCSSPRFSVTVSRCLLVQSQALPRSQPPRSKSHTTT